MTGSAHRSRRDRSRHGNVIAYLALFAALAGSAFAAATIGSGDVINNSLKSADLKNNAGVKGADVRDRTLRGGDVANGSLATADLGNNSLGAADVNEQTLLVEQVTRRLGGAMGLPVTGSLSNKLVPNSAFTQAAGESDQMIAGGQVTFSAACVQPRAFVAYLLLDDPVLAPSSIIGLAQVNDTGAGAATTRFTFNPGGFQNGGLNLFRTGAPVNHQFFIQATASCNSGAGVTIDSANLSVIGHR